MLFYKLIDKDYIRKNMKTTLKAINSNPELYEDFLLDFMKIGLWELPYWTAYLRKVAAVK